MKFKTNVMEKKELVKAVSEALGVKAVYLGAPSFSYKIGPVTVLRDATLETEGAEGEEAVKAHLTDLAPHRIDEPVEEESETETETSISIPIGNAAPQGIVNLINMIHSKQHLLNRALKAEKFIISDFLVEKAAAQNFESMDAVLEFMRVHENEHKGITFSDDAIIFTGFLFEDDMTPLIKLAAAMVKTATEKKRISPKTTIEENEKYYMRAWLVSIGLGGINGKDVRTFLLRNLNGHTAFRTPADEEKWKAARKAERGN